MRPAVTKMRESGRTWTGIRPGGPAGRRSPYSGSSPGLAYGRHRRKPEPGSRRNSDVDPGVGFIAPARLDLAPGDITCLIQRPVLGRPVMPGLRPRQPTPVAPGSAEQPEAVEARLIQGPARSGHPSSGEPAIAGFRAVQRRGTAPDPGVLGPKPAGSRCMPGTRSRRKIGRTGHHQCNQKQAATPATSPKPQHPEPNSKTPRLRPAVSLNQDGDGARAAFILRTARPESARVRARDRRWNSS